jgi:CheY-like chemotaxis protein
MSSILVVDDEPAIVETVAELLTWEGHSVLTANDGAQALGELRRGAAPVDVILLDFMMPVKDGIQTLREIRADEKLASVKVILTTAAPTSIPKDAPSYDALLVKPFSVDDLRDAIARVLQK